MGERGTRSVATQSTSAARSVAAIATAACDEKPLDHARPGGISVIACVVAVGGFIGEPLVDAVGHSIEDREEDRPVDTDFWARGAAWPVENRTGRTDKVQGMYAGRRCGGVELPRFSPSRWRRRSRPVTSVGLFEVGAQAEVFEDVCSDPRRPDPTTATAASPLAGAHHIGRAVDHGLVSRTGTASFVHPDTGTFSW